MQQRIVALGRAVVALSIVGFVGLGLSAGVASAQSATVPCGTGSYAPLTNAGASPNAISQSTLQANPDMCGGNGTQGDH